LSKGVSLYPKGYWPLAGHGEKDTTHDVFTTSSVRAGSIRSTVRLGVAVGDQSPGVGVEMIVVCAASSAVQMIIKDLIDSLACFAPTRLLGQCEGDKKRGEAQLRQDRPHIVFVAVGRIGR